MVIEAVSIAEQPRAASSCLELGQVERVAPGIAVERDEVPYRVAGPPPVAGGQARHLLRERRERSADSPADRSHMWPDLLLCRRLLKLRRGFAA